jgi:hypothetical protein
VAALDQFAEVLGRFLIATLLNRVDVQLRADRWSRVDRVVPARS